MKTPTSIAPHIWWNVRENMSRSCAPVTRSNSATIIHDAKMALPPMKGANVNVALTTLPGVSDECAATEDLNNEMCGRLDHGPVHRTTTTIRTMNGSQARNTSAADSSRPVRAAAATSAETGTPP